MMGLSTRGRGLMCTMLALNCSKSGAHVRWRISRLATCPAGSTRRRVLAIATAADVMAEAQSRNHVSAVSTKSRVIFCLGGPGAGKGTQCERLEREFGFVHLSAGQLLRSERESGSADGELIESYLSEGKIVPVALSLGLLRREMESRNSSRFIIDGFPRNQDNLDGWNELMSGVSKGYSCLSKFAHAGIADVDCVLFYDVPVKELVRRMISRGETSGRSDDNVAAAEKRIATFYESTMPLIDQWERSGELKARTHRLFFCRLSVSGCAHKRRQWHRRCLASNQAISRTLSRLMDTEFSYSRNRS